VVGANKPGRVAFTVTDLTVPVAGLPITVGRSYDSLERGAVGDFGHGWSLSVGNPRLRVNTSTGDVTLTLQGGRRVTFYFTPRAIPIFGLLTGGYTAEAGAYGSLSSDGCNGIIPGGSFDCAFGNNYLRDAGTYTYSDPYGRVYRISPSGQLRSLTDLQGDTLSFGASGITSSAGGLSVPFARDGQGRITQVTDPAGNIYRYSYDANGDLAGVDLPGVPAPAGQGHSVSYSYDPTHLFTGAVDPRGSQIAASTYYADGRLKGVTDAAGNTTAYAYDVPGGTTTITNPDGGVDVRQTDGYGMLVSETDPLGRTIAYSYDANHNLTGRTDATGTASYTYDGSGNRTGVTYPSGKITRATYNQYSGLSSLTDPMNNVTTIQIDGTFQPVALSDSVGSLGGYSWDSHGSPLTRTDGNGGLTAFSYDAYGNVISQADPLQNTTTFTYDQLGEKLTSTDPLSRTTMYSYDALGRLQTLTDPLHRVTTYRYDGAGNRTAETDPAGRTTSYQYDAASRLTKVLYPDGSTETRTYDWRGNELLHTDQAGHVTRRQYDLDGELTGTTLAYGTSDSSSTSYAYDAAGRTRSQTDGRGFVTAYDYDSAGRLLHVTDPLQQVTTYGYDDDGHRTSVTDPAGHQTQYSYDARGNLSKTTYADGTLSTQSYDGAGNLQQQTDQAGKATTYVYDGANELLSVTNPMHQTTGYNYDPNGNLLAVTDANGHITRFAYDELNRQVHRTWPDGSSDTYSFDPATGDQVAHQLADGQVNLYSYDNMDRLTGISYFDGQAAGFTYTPTGQRQTATDGRGTTNYQYDSQDRLTGVAAPGGQQVRYTYDAAGDRLTTGTTAGTVTYVYDELNRLSRVTDPQGQMTAYQYDHAGNRQHLALPNGVTEDDGYDALGRVASIVQHRGSSPPLASYTYSFDPAGNRTSVTEGNGSGIRWTYDDASRLTGETRLSSGNTITSQTAYTYDQVGNRLTMVADGHATGYSYNNLDQLTGAGTAQYRYDGRGNLAQVTDGASVTNYRWDAGDRLTGVTMPDGTTAGYMYDVDGRRVGQSVAGIATSYVWDEASRYGDVLAETGADGTLQASYVLGDGTLLAQNRAGATSYYLRDGQGNVRTLVDATGAATDSYSYSAFGVQQASTGTATNPYRYTGQRMDPLTGLYSLRARYLDPATGRFLSRDPLQAALGNTAELDRYTYAGDNPATLDDPSGQAVAAGALPRGQVRGAGLEYVALLSLAALAAPAVVRLGVNNRCQVEYFTSVLFAIHKNDVGLIAMKNLFPDSCYLPLYETSSGGNQPTIAFNIYTAQHLHGQPMLLTYLGFRDRRRYRAACGSGNFRLGPSPYTSCDEYPFATTVEGGAGATTLGVPVGEQSSQGGTLGNFYTRYRGTGVAAGEWFAAIVVP